MKRLASGIQNLFLSGIFATLAMISVSSVHAQSSLNELFRIEANGNVPWFNSDDTTRGMALNPKGNLLVADREPEVAIYQLDPKTGFQVGQLDTFAISGGTLPLGKISTTQDGRIIACNIAAETSMFKVYYYHDEYSSPVVIYQEENAQARWGDDLVVSGIGARMTIAVSGSDNPQILLISDPDGDGVFTSRTVTPINPPIVGINNIAFDLDKRSFWLRQSTEAGASASQYSMQGGIGTRKAGYGEGLGPIDMVLMDGTTIFAISPGLVSEAYFDTRGYLIDIERSSTPKWQTSNLAHSDGTKKNGNGTGEVIVDVANRRAYFLLTNNTISGWSIPFQ